MYVNVLLSSWLENTANIQCKTVFASSTSCQAVFLVAYKQLSNIETPDKLTHWIFVEAHFFRLENWSTKTLKPSDQTSRNEGTDVCFRTGTLRWYRCLTFGRWLLGTNPRRHKQNLFTFFCFQDIAQFTDHPFESFEVSSFEMVFTICILWLGVGMTCWFMTIHSSSPSI